MDLNESVQNSEKMLRRLIGEDILLATILEPRLHRLKADPGQIDQVIMNLVLNARDAMPRGGRITVETGNVELDGAIAAEHPEIWPGPYVLLGVRDTGTGMDEATLSRIFEPLFTTKPLEKGTGLGLAVVHSIVQQSGGHIVVNSQLGNGTEFRIYFPSADGLQPR
jgi:signal transduction histidine kinase